MVNRADMSERLRRDLAEVPELYQRCESLLVRFPPAFTQRVAGSGTTGLVLDERVTEARRGLVAVLASWSGLVADERGVTRPRRRGTAELAAFLAIHLDWLLAHPAGACFAEELLASAAAAREVSRNGPGLGIELGRCVTDSCDSTMMAARGTSLQLEVRCAAGHAWPPRQWLWLARQIQARG